MGGVAPNSGTPVGRPLNGYVPYPMGWVERSNLVEMCHYTGKPSYSVSRPTCLQRVMPVILSPVSLTSSIFEVGRAAVSNKRAKVLNSWRSCGGDLCSSGTQRHCRFENIKYPAQNVLNTYVAGINAKQTVVGGYSRYETVNNQSVLVAHGFMRSNGAYFPIDVPGAKGTAPNGLNANGEIVGVYKKKIRGSAQGFVLGSSGYTQIKVPGFDYVSSTGMPRY
jgi:hypothetical protein